MTQTNCTYCGQPLTTAATCPNCSGREDSPKAMEYLKAKRAKQIGRDKTQTETIIWHKYPDEKPKTGSDYLVTYQSEAIPDYTFAHVCPYLSGMWYEKHKIPIPVRIIAWAKLPKGWKDE